MRGRATQECLFPVLLLAASLVGSGCTTLQSTQLPPEDLRYGIRSGSLVQPGDELSVVTADGKEYSLTVGDVGEEEIRGERPGGEELTLAIDDLVALRTHQVDATRTTFAVLGGAFGLGLVTIFILGFLTFALTFA